MGCVKAYRLKSEEVRKPLYALILTPTRELAMQVKNHLTKVAKYTGKVYLLVRLCWYSKALVICRNQRGGCSGRDGSSETRKAVEKRAGDRGGDPWAPVGAHSARK